MDTIPVTILGGSDNKPGALPPSGAGLHSLSAYKGAAIRIGGRPLVAVLVERLAAAGGFGPVKLAGPSRVYAPFGLDAAIVDTDGSVAENLRAAIEAHARDVSRPASRPGMLGVLACDVLPSVAELRTLRRRFEEARPCALWFPFVPVADPSALGAFAWKPAYRLVPRGATEAVRILPGHLCIFDPDALRLPLLFRLLDTTYRTRNRSIASRRATLLRTGLLALLMRDARLLARGRFPGRTATVVSSGLRLARRLRRGTLGQAELERLIGRIFVRAHVPPEHGIRYPIVDVPGLAADADTEEEALQMTRAARGDEAPGS